MSRGIIQLLGEVMRAGQDPVATDDHGELWLSSNDDPENVTLISNVNGYSGVTEWNKYGSQQSAPIPLVAGNKYYIEAIWREGTGGGV